MFLNHINCFPQGLQADVKLFADYISLFSVANNIDEIVSKQTVGWIHMLSKENRMFKSVVFSGKMTFKYPPQTAFNVGSFSQMAKARQERFLKSTSKFSRRSVASNFCYGVTCKSKMWLEMTSFLKASHFELSHRCKNEWCLRVFPEKKQVLEECQKCKNSSVIETYPHLLKLNWQHNLYKNFKSFRRYLQNWVVIKCPKLENWLQ